MKAEKFRLKVDGVQVGILGIKLLETGRKDIKKSFYRVRRKDQARRINYLQRTIEEVKQNKHKKYNSKDLPWLLEELKRTRNGEL